jgi:hypothetical protein
VNRLIVCALLMAGCDPVWSLSVTVRSPSQEPLPDAALVLTGCPQQNDHDLGTVAALTDSQGVGTVGGAGSEYPQECTITVARPGFLTYQSSFAELCNDDTSNCDRGQEIVVVLEPVP